MIGIGLTPRAGGGYIADIEDLFLFAESEDLDFGRYECYGVLEWRNVGILGKAK